MPPKVIALNKELRTLVNYNSPLCGWGIGPKIIVLGPGGFRVSGIIEVLQCSMHPTAYALRRQALTVREYYTH